MAENFLLGRLCKLYRCATLLSDDNTPEVADWADEIDNVKDVTTGGTTEEADITTRANNGWKATATTLKDGSLVFEMLWKPDDDAFADIQAAWLGGDEIAMAAMSDDIDTPGAEGLVANFSVANFTRNEPVAGVVTVNVTVKPSSFADWYVVAS